MLYLLSVWLHILAAAAWIGGMVFFTAVLLPAVRRPELQEAGGRLLRATARRLRLLGWTALILLVATGLANLHHRIGGWSSLAFGTFWQSRFGLAFALKMMVVAAILSVSALHDFDIGPRAGAAWREEPESPRARRLRRAAAWMGRLNLILALVAVALGVVLVRGWRF